MKVGNINIILSLLILISLSLLCHIKQWIPSDKFTNINKYSSLECPGNCNNDCNAIHAELPDEFLRKCSSTSPSATLSADDIKKYLTNLYLLKANYTANRKFKLL